jgi:3-oxoisoapionate decarboxylase
MKRGINRRDFAMQLAAASLAAGCASRASGEPAPRKSKLGLVTYVFTIHQRAAKGDGNLADLNDPLTFLEESHRLGAGGMQFPFGLRDEADLRRVREKAEAYGMHVEAILQLPRSSGDLDRFEKQVLAAKNAGATLARATVLPGRRYEQFNTLDEYRRASEEGVNSVRRAEPLLARHRFHLALENHKDLLADDLLKVLRQVGSEFVGLCVDVANNFALLEDPIETATAFAPHGLTVHIKDLGIRPCEEGFWLSDEALGAGFLDLRAIVAILRRSRRDVRFNLEVITRDPIKVPVQTEKYWATFPGRSRTAMEPMLKLAREKGPAGPLTAVSALPKARQLELERNNIERSLRYARDVLDM